MKFTELLRTGVLLAAASATVLAAGAVVFGIIDSDQDIVLLCTLWWVLAATSAQLIVNQRGVKVTHAIGKLLADARPQRMQEEPHIGRTVANRLWPVGLLTFLALLGTAVFGAQVAGAGAGFPIVWALLWRGQEAAVKAVEERDGVAFHVETKGPLKPLSLTRGPGLRRDLTRGAKTDAERTAST